MYVMKGMQSSDGYHDNIITWSVYFLKARCKIGMCQYLGIYSIDSCSNDVDGGTMWWLLMWWGWCDEDDRRSWLCNDVGKACVVVYASGDDLFFCHDTYWLCDDGDYMCSMKVMWSSDSYPGKIITLIGVYSEGMM